MTAFTDGDKVVGDKSLHPHGSLKKLSRDTFSIRRRYSNNVAFRFLACKRGRTQYRSVMPITKYRVAHSNGRADDLSEAADAIP